MKRCILDWGLVFSLLTTSVLAIAHERTGWMAPEEAMKMKNPVKLTKASAEKGKEIYEKKCASCHGVKGDGKGAAGARLNPKPTNFKESHGEKMTMENTSGKSLPEKGICHPLQGI